MKVETAKDERDTPRPAAQPTPGRHHLRTAALVGAVIVEFIVAVGAWQFALTMARLGDPSGGAAGRLLDVLGMLTAISVSTAVVGAAGYGALVALRRRRP